MANRLPPSAHLSLTLLWSAWPCSALNCLRDYPSLRDQLRSLKTGAVGTPDLDVAFVSSHSVCWTENRQLISKIPWASLVFPEKNLSFLRFSWEPLEFLWFFSNDLSLLWSAHSSPNWDPFGAQILKGMVSSKIQKSMVLRKWTCFIILIRSKNWNRKTPRRFAVPLFLGAPLGYPGENVVGRRGGRMSFVTSAGQLHTCPSILYASPTSAL